MPNLRLATRYAKSLLDLSAERNEMEKVFTDMQWLQGVTRSNRDFVNFLRSPIIKADTKKKILQAVTGGKLSELTNTFMNLLVNKGRERHLPEIISSFISQYKEKKNIHIVKLTTATPVNESTKAAIINQLKQSGEYQNIELEEKVDENIIGGFVVQVGDKLIDASIAYDLKAVARQFENNDFIFKVR